MTSQTHFFPYKKQYQQKYVTKERETMGKKNFYRSEIEDNGIKFAF